MKDAIWPSEACQRSGGSTCKSTIVAEFGNRRVFLQELLECTTLHTFLAFAETFPAEVLLLPILASFFGQKLPHSTGLAKEPSVGIIKK